MATKAKTWEELGVMPPGRTLYWEGLLNPRELASSDYDRLYMSIDVLEASGVIPSGCVPGMFGPLCKPSRDERVDDLHAWGNLPLHVKNRPMDAGWL
jgi:hypothetical protein